MSAQLTDYIACKVRQMTDNELRKEYIAACKTGQEHDVVSTTIRVCAIVEAYKRGLPLRTI